MKSFTSLLGIVLLLIVFTCPHDAVAGSCTSAAKVAGDIWEKFDAVTKEAGCWSPGKLGHYQACFIERLKFPLKLGDKMVGWWNSMAEGGWATIGPRMLSVGKEKGTLISTGGRLFIGSSPVNTGELTLSLRKTDGEADVEVTVCKTGADRKAEKIWEFTINKGDKNTGKTWEKTFKDVEAAVISVHLDSKALLKKFSYELQMQAKPQKNDLGPVKGFADIHSHEMSELGFHGSWYRGDHTGPQATALKKCSDLEPHAVPNFTGIVKHGEPGDKLENWPRWDDIAHQEVYRDWLKHAHEKGLNLMVMSAVNFEPICEGMMLLYPNQNTKWGCRDMEVIKRQLEAAIDMADENNWYVIAVDPWHARQIIHDGKLAVVLSLEASHLLPKDEGDYIEQLDKLYNMGLRTLQIAHETDSRFAGAAPHSHYFDLFQKLKWPFLNTLKPGWNLDDKGKNKQDLTDDGKKLLEAMMKRHMLIDLAHLSERSVDDVFDLVKKHDYYPLYNSHTRFKDILTEEHKEKQREFLTPCKQIQYLEQTGGMVGLRTGDNPTKTYSKNGRVLLENNCAGSSRSLAQIYLYGINETPLPIAFGSDFNGFISQAGPRFGPEACPQGEKAQDKVNQGAMPNSVSREFNIKGLSHVGLLPDLVADFKVLGVDTTRLENSAEAFLQMWERTYDGNRRGKPVQMQCER